MNAPSDKKKEIIHNLISRDELISSSKIIFYNEVENIKQALMNNGFPNNMLHTYTYWIHTDAMITDARIKDAGRKTQEWRTHEDFFRKIFPSHFIARVRKGCWRVACERMLETEHKLHILTPLLWPSRCVFIVLLMFNQRSWGPLHRGFSEGPLGRVWPSLPHLVSSCLEFCWQLLRRFPRSPSVVCGLPYYISSLTLWESAGNCSGTQTQLS